eukprot:TRINITY_DN27917_c0_g1_i1.p1 TRINITY_DN27917_c0_g1~~TRINITY_DN27917_c0_g1_i1.p1  ORF type:complete len:488 (+),score=71.56 TRINITY_DN27917_c0_g1_i1:94-1557(+)
MLCQKVEGCAHSVFDTQILNRLFPGIEIISVEYSVKCVDMIRENNNSTLLLAIVDDLLECPTDLACFETTYIAPCATFFRKEVLKKNKVSSSVTLANWEIGNQQFALLYESALIALIDQGYISNVFKLWSYPYYWIEDCMTQPCGVGKLADYYGTAGIVLGGKVRIGALRWDMMPLIDTTDPKFPQGIIPAIEKQIFTWIATQFSLKAINLSYSIFSSTQEVFLALKSGEVDVTSMFFYIGSFNTENETVYRRNNEYYTSCTTMGLDSYFVTRISSNFTSSEDLRNYTASNPYQTVGVTDPATGWMMAWPLRGLNYTLLMIPDAQELLETLANNTTLIAVGFPNSLDISAYPTLMQFRSGVVTPCAAFFRRDKSFPCGSDELESYLGEMCETVDPSCATNCTCDPPYVNNSEAYGCLETKPLDIYLLVIIVCSGVTTLTVIVVILVLALLIPYLRKRAFVAGAHKMRDSLFFQRRGGTYKPVPVNSS